MTLARLECTVGCDGHLREPALAVAGLAELQPSRPQPEIPPELPGCTLIDEVDAAYDGALCQALLPLQDPRLFPQPSQLLKIGLVLHIPAQVPSNLLT